MSESAVVNDYPTVPAQDVRVGDVLRPSTDYVGDDDSTQAMEVGTDRGWVSVTWHTIGEQQWTHLYHPEDRIRLMRRGPVRPDEEPTT